MQSNTFSKLSASIYSKGRFYIEKSSLRSPYQRDRDRIFTLPLLEVKTQNTGFC